MSKTKRKPPTRKPAVKEQANRKAIITAVSVFIGLAAVMALLLIFSK